MLARARVMALPLTAASIRLIEDGSGGYLQVQVCELATYLKLCRRRLRLARESAAEMDDFIPDVRAASTRPSYPVRLPVKGA